jgi:hypothetical protein
MNKYIAALMAIGFIYHSALAQSYSALSYHYGSLTTENANVMQIQSLGEIVGGNSVYHQLRYGISTVDSADIGKSDIFIFAYNAPDKNNEVGFGLGGIFSGSPINSTPKLTWKLGGEGGYGWQSVKGQSKTISTNINKFTFVTSSNGYDRFKVPTKMTYEEDTQVLNLTLVTGLGYDITRQLRVEGDISYRAAYYQFAYRNQGSGILNALTATQDQWITTAGMTYRF